jgi:hypothetical protein
MEAAEGSAAIIFSSFIDIFSYTSNVSNESDEIIHLSKGSRK